MDSPAVGHSDLQDLGKHLSLLSAELHGHNEEKEVLNELVRQQRHTITLALQRTKELRMSIDRKHKEAVATQEKTKKYVSGGLRIRNEVVQLKKEIAQLEHERDLFMLETEQLRHEIQLEAEAVKAFTEITNKGQKETMLQTKEKEANKKQAVALAKTASQLRLRIREFMAQNSAFLCALNLEAHPALMQQLPLQLTETIGAQHQRGVSFAGGRPRSAQPIAFTASTSGGRHRGKTFAGTFR